jgi:hypothetical protein
MRLARRTRPDRMAAHRKLDRRRVDLCEGGLRKRGVGWGGVAMAEQVFRILTNLYKI